MLIYIFLAVIIIVGCFLGMLYYVLKGKLTEVSQQPPYQEVLNKVLVLQRPAYLVKHRPPEMVHVPYYLSEEKQISEGAEMIGEVPTGTPVTFMKAIHYRGGTSGVTSSLLIGEVEFGPSKEKFKFEYQWGEYHFICVEDPCDYWTFPKAVWQLEADPGKYFMNEK